MKRVAIIHPWFPQYRQAVFASLVEQAASEGLDIRIFHGDPPPEWAERGDSVTAGYATRLPTKFVKVGARSLGIKSLRPFRRAGRFDLVILEQAIRNLESYRFLTRRGFGRLAWWGHGRTYTSPKSNWEERLKARLTRMGDWFFAYTPGGAAAVVSTGFPPNNVTVVNNSIDTAELQSAMRDVSAQELELFRQDHNITERTIAFIGGLDESKRLDLLLAAGEMVARSSPSFRMIVVGNGPLRNKIAEFSRANSWCIYLGGLYGRQRAIALSAAQALAIPGRVGLVAVDSFAARRPIITTEYAYHAPEFEYLVDGLNAVVTADSVYAYAQGIDSLLADPERVLELQRGCAKSAHSYSAEAMASNLLDGIRRTLAL